MKRAIPISGLVLSGSLAVATALVVFRAGESQPALAQAGRVASMSGRPLSFNEHVLPILSENCFQCHGLDANARKADLRLDREEFAFAPRKDGPVIVRGEPAKSPLIRRIESTDPKMQMPPPEAHRQLKPEQVARLRQWVQEGARYEMHWAYLKPVRPKAPATQNNEWGHGAIDQFILARLEQEGLTPAPEADRYALIRRVTFDLTGLPPTPAEIGAFLSDESPRAYEQLVDRLLASPRYGEHRARYWLDAARHADTTGLHRDPFRLTWPYRDYVIKSYNENKSFDRFATEQIAGDLLPAESLDPIIATGFNRGHITTSEVGEVTEELQLANVNDRVATVSTVFLGLTSACASCHDHKFDPITQRDYYQLSAFFNNSLDPPADNEEPTNFPTVTLPPPDKRADAEKLLQERAALEREIFDRAAQVEALMKSWVVSDEARKLKPVSTDKLVARFRFDEGKGDIVHNTAPGASPTAYRVEQQPPVWGDEAVRHWPSMRLGTKSIVALGQLGDFESTDAFSVAGWFKPRLGRGVDKRGSLLSKMALGEKNRGWDVYWEYADPPDVSVHQRWAQGRLVVNLIHEGPENAITVRATRVFGRVEWVHLAFTYDGSGKAGGVRLYVNGEEQDVEIQKDGLNGSIRTTAPLQLARRTDGGKEVETTPLYECSYQDLRLYARALASREIRGTIHKDFAVELLARDHEQWNADERKSLQEFYFARVDSKMQAWTAAKTRLDNRLEAITEGGIRASVLREKATAASAFVLDRGVYNQRKERVWADVPAFLPRLPADAPRDRLGFAQWLVSRENPLTARVTVNRMWQELFGAGLVTTPGDFGVVGARPSHPQLLDWLAVDFEESGWNVKRFYKQILMSATYRQSARTTPLLSEKDPANRLLARGPRFRLDAEMIRDSALAASGLLVEKLGGASVNMYQPPGIWEAISMGNSKTRTHQPDKGEGLYRRSVYTYWKRTSPPPVLETFDAPQREVCVVQRERTNTPLQALVMLNAPHFLEASRNLAARAMRQPDTGPAQKVDYLAALLVTKPLVAVDRQTLLDTYDTFRRRFDQRRAKEFLAVGDSPVDASLPAPELAAWTIVANQLLNSDQALNK